MQENNMAEKKKVLWDREEIPGLVSVDEIAKEKGNIEVPSFKKISKVQNGIRTMPDLVFTYKIERGTNTLQFFKDFDNNNEVKDCTIIRTDAHGDEFARTVWTQCEVLTRTEPAYDAATPDYAKVTITVAPDDLIEE